MMEITAEIRALIDKAAVGMELAGDEYIDPADGLIHCKKCGGQRQTVVPCFGKSGYFMPHCICQCQREAEEQRKAAEERQRRMERIKRRKAQGLQDRYLYDYTFSNDNGQNPLMDKAHAYVENWKEAYTALKAQHPDTLVGFEAGGNFMFYGEDAAKVAKVLNSALFTRETALGEVQVTGFPPSLWVRKSKELWSAGNDVYLAGLNEDGTHHQTKHLHKEDYLPIGSIINMDGRKFRIDGVDFDKGKVSLQDMALADLRMPIFREEPLALVRELYEEQDMMGHPLPDYKVGDNAIVDLPTRTIEGTIGYVGETDVRIDTSAQGYSWSNEVLNKQQFEDSLRRDEPTSDESLDKLPISGEVNGEWQTFPDAAALDEALNAEPAPEPAGNFHITDDHLGEGGAKQKYARNIAAIRTLFQLEQEHRGATAEEQEVLSQYVGWGGLPDAFDPDKSNWSKEYTELKGLLSEDEYAAARSSVLNAHYTSPTVIRSIYVTVERMGFRSGNILEPSMGVGNFFGMLPESMADSRLYGVELDSITGRIAQKLYPEANIKVAGFETTDRRDFYDLAVGNVPFGNYKVNDKSYNKLNFSIHNYFFAKAIDQVRPGGVVAFVTSRYTLDSKDSSARKHMAERADLLGAIRLPNNAFRANAGTDVVSDIIFLQKRDRPIDHEPDWIQLGKTEDGFTINSYFVDHPEMVLGELTTESTQYGREECTVRPIEGAVLADQLAEAIQHIEGLYTEVEVETPDIADAENERHILPADPDVKNFSYTVVDGEVYYRENSVMTQVELSDTAKGRVTGMVELRQIVNELIDQQLNDYPDADIQATQEKLNAAYDAFSAKYGLLNDRKNGRLFEQDSSYHAKLLILDPMSSYIGESCSMNNANETRAEFNHLIAVAKDTGCAIVIIAHMNKMRDTNPLYRTNGSIDIAGAARSILAITRTPNKEAPTERYLVQVKSNLAPTGSAILFEVSEKGVDFISEMEMTAEEAFQSLAPKIGRPNDKEVKAKAFLIEMLKDGEMLSSDCEEKLEAAGFRKSTIKKAKKNAGVISRKKGFLWYWSLPMGDIPRE